MCAVVLISLAIGVAVGAVKFRLQYEIVIKGHHLKNAKTNLAELREYVENGNITSKWRGFEQILDNIDQVEHSIDDIFDLYEKSFFGSKEKSVFI